MRPATPLRMRLQATLALAGAFTLWAWLGGLGPAIAVLVTGPLAIVAWLSPRHYAPVQSALDRFVQSLLAVITWVLLGLVFGLVFVPGRLLIGRKRFSTRSRSATHTTYWRTVRRASPIESFRRQF